MKTTLLLTLLVASLFNLKAQVSQSIRGEVIDRQSGVTLPGVNIYIQGSDPLIGTVTDADGRYIISDVPLGRHNISAQFVGYELETQTNILVGSGRQTEVNFSLQESATSLEGVVISSWSLSKETVNSMSFVSGRTFSVEETRRYAGGLDDPARLVSAYAGVSAGNIQDNAIIVRGNNPKYISWHLEGVEIPNPNHFSSINVIGGGFVTIFSNQLLANSDFYTGAFAAEYGNVLSGVFDMRLRSGNSQKREYTFQAGAIGLDFAAEGPFIKGKNSSYLANYRYSTMSLVAPLIPSEQVPKYQDLSFKLNFPNQKYGTFSVWGIGALDGNIQPKGLDSTKWENSFDRMAYEFTQRTGAIGLTHRKIFGTQTFINTSVVTTANQFIMDMKRVNNNLLLDDNWYGNNMEGKNTLKSFVNHKFNESHTNRTGIIINNLFYSLENRAAINNQLPVVTLSNEKGRTALVQMFTQSQFNVFKKTTANIGLHATYLQMNGEVLLEPRVGFEQAISNKHRISLGYGMHSSLEPLRVYFLVNEEDGNKNYPNKNLRLTKAHHIIANYDWMINQNLRVKVEPYYQRLYDVPVIPDSIFSMINFEQDFHFNNELENLGKGRNFGVDFTFERFFNSNYYYLLTTSIFKSEFETSDGRVYPTRYDKGFVVNALGGKEFVFNRNHRNTIGINGRVTIAGGNKVTPINKTLSNQERTVVYNWEKPFANQNPTDYYVDISLSWRVDRDKVANILSIQIKNLLGSPSEYHWTYNYSKQEVEHQSYTIVMPNISYRVEF